MTAVAEQSSDLPGLTVFFRPGENDRVERTVATLKRLGIQRLRVPVADPPHARTMMTAPNGSAPCCRVWLPNSICSPACRPTRPTL